MTSDSKLVLLIPALSNKIKKISSCIENISGNILEYIAIILYAIFHLLMAIVHEPWYDEAVAWQIARCASLSEILFEIPHYEGHPPLWYLILIPFAKLGAPYELSLTLVSLIFAGAAVGLIIWKSPFPRIIRLLLPFTYFFFYQYGVISRPYCVMMLAFVLLAMTYQNRNIQPGRHVLCLMLLCLTSAYGILLAGGIALVWVLEIWNRQNIIKFIKSFVSDKRIWHLAGLLALALLLIVEIIPAEDTFATNLVEDTTPENNLFVRIIYMLLASVPDVLYSDIFWDYGLLATSTILYPALAGTSIVGLLILTVIAFYGRCKRTALTFFVPFVLFAVFAAVVYVSPHHIGIVLLLLVFWLWISLQAQDIDSKHLNRKYEEIISGIIILFITASMGVSLSWTISASVEDVKRDYAVGRDVANFIKENNLDDYRIMGQWRVEYDDDRNVISMNTNRFLHVDNIAPYFEHNIIYNFMDGEDSLNYSSHKVASEEQNEINLSKWKTDEYPDVLYMQPPLDLVWDYDELSYVNYRLVYHEFVSRIWKTNTKHNWAVVFVRTDLADELGLEPVEFKSPYLIEE